MSVSPRSERCLTPLSLIDDEIINIPDAQAINLNEGCPSNAQAFVLPERPRPTLQLQ